MENNSKLIEALEAVKRELMPNQEAEEAPKYATSEELNSVKEEIMALLSAQNNNEGGDEDCDDNTTSAGEPTDLKPPVNGVAEQDEKLSEEVEQEEVQEEDSQEEEEAGVTAELSDEEKVTHSPESETQKLSGFKWGGKRPENMVDRIRTKLYS